MTLNHFKLFTLGLCCFLFVQNVWADGLTDLRQALIKLEGSEPISGILTVHFTETQGEKKDKTVKNGEISSSLVENAEGIEIRYSKEILKKIAQENHAKIGNEDADTPTLNGAERLSASSLIPILSSAQVIADHIEKGKFQEESTIDYLGKKVRVLDFTLPLESFIDNKKIRSYVSKFKGSYKIIINDDGTPIETRMSYSGKGSAYIFFSMKAEGAITSQFQTYGTRLVRVNRTQESRSSSTFNKRTYIDQWALVLQD